MDYNNSITRNMLSIKDYDKEFKEHLKDIREFVDSLDNCSVSYEIMGEWNVIRKEIHDYLFNNNVGFDGSCTKLKNYYYQELEHLNSIKSKLGNNAIEYQMICSLFAESVLLDIKSSKIYLNMIHKLDRLGLQISYPRMLKDCLNVIGNVAELNMEYQYKYEIFKPYHNSLSEEGRKLGLIYSEPKSSSSGCMGVIALMIMSTLLCSYLFL